MDISDIKNLNGRSQVLVGIVLILPTLVCWILGGTDIEGIPGIKGWLAE